MREVETFKRIAGLSGRALEPASLDVLRRQLASSIPLEDFRCMTAGWTFLMIPGAIQRLAGTSFATHEVHAIHRPNPLSIDVKVTDLGSTIALVARKDSICACLVQCTANAPGAAPSCRASKVAPSFRLARFH